MQNITIHRYATKDEPVYSGCVQPHDRSWALYIRRDGAAPDLFVDRDPETGAAQRPKTASEP